MRGQDHQQSDMFSYLSPEQRVRQDRPLRKIRAMADQALANISERFDAMYAKTNPLAMLEQIPGLDRVTVGADKVYDTKDFVAECRNIRVTPHWRKTRIGRAGSAIDERTTRRPGYGISEKKRKRIEESLAWLKTIALLRRVRHHGIHKVGWVFTFAGAAYNLVRMRNLLASPVGAA
jgi:hypothetical protein